MTWLCILVGIALGSAISLNIRSIQHLRRLSFLEDKDFVHTTRLNLQEERLEKLEKELEELKKEQQKSIRNIV